MNRDVHIPEGNRALCDVVTRVQSPLGPLGAPFGGGPQPVGVLTSGGSIGGIAPVGGSVGTQRIVGTCPPVQTGFGLDSNPKDTCTTQHPNAVGSQLRPAVQLSPYRHRFAPSGCAAAVGLLLLLLLLLLPTLLPPASQKVATCLVGFQLGC